MRRPFYRGAIFLACLAALPALALDPGPLPEIKLIPLEGRGRDRVDPGEWESWILVYVQPDCEPCNRLLAELEKAVPGSGMPRVAIVLGGMEPEPAAELRRIYPGLAGAQWVADPARKIYRRLDLPGVPVLVAGRRAVVSWTAGGVPLVGGALRSLLGVWLDRGDAPSPPDP
jgi:hypothetical protein